MISKEAMEQFRDRCGLEGDRLTDVSQQGIREVMYASAALYNAIISASEVNRQMVAESLRTTLDTILEKPAGGADERAVEILTASSDTFAHAQGIMRAALDALNAGAVLRAIEILGKALNPEGQFTWTATEEMKAANPQLYK